MEVKSGSGHTMLVGRYGRSRKMKTKVTQFFLKRSNGTPLLTRVLGECAHWKCVGPGGISSVCTSEHLFSLKFY